MKNLKSILFLVSLLMGWVAFSQVIGELELKGSGRASGGMSEKKFKKAPKKAYIAEFRVMYQLLYTDEESTQGGRTMGGGYRGSTKASIAVGINSVQHADLIETTNKLYTEYIDRLKNEGFEIVTTDQVSGISAFEGWEKVQGGGLNEAQFPGYIMSTPEGFEYFIKKTTKKGRQKGSFTDNSVRISSEIDGAVVFKVNLTFPFIADAESRASKALGKSLGGISKIVVKPSFRLIENGLRTSVNFSYGFMKIKPEAVGKVILKKPLTINGVFEDKKYKAISTADANQNWSGASMIVFENRSITNAQVADCEANQYKNGIYQAGSKFLTASLDRFIGHTNGN